VKYYALISTNDFYRVEFEAPDGMNSEAIEQYIYENWGEWEKEPQFGGADDHIIWFGPTTPEVTP
jgi:hypothetical protein